MINYYRFCCRIRIADEYADEVPGGEFLAVEQGDARDRREQFSDSRVNEFSDWFHETPRLTAHIRAVQSERKKDTRTRLLSTKDACLLTGRDRHTLYRWAREGLVTEHWAWFAHERAGRQRGWDPVELDAVLKEFARKA